VTLTAPDPGRAAQERQTGAPPAAESERDGEVR
jgi:hypothetical protein